MAVARPWTLLKTNLLTTHMTGHELRCVWLTTHCMQLRPISCIHACYCVTSRTQVLCDRQWVSILLNGTSAQYRPFSVMSYCATDNDVRRLCSVKGCIWNKTRCVAVPSLMGARWVGQNSGPIFRCFWTKVHWIKFARAGVSVVCTAVFRLTISCWVPEIFKSKFWCFGPPNFGGKGSPKFLIEFYKSGSPWNVAKFGDDRPSDLEDYRRRKKKIYSKQQR